MIKYLSFILLLFVLIPVRSQHTHKEHNHHDVKKREGRYKREYLSGTVIFKIRPEKNPEFVRQKDKSPELNKILKEVGMTSLSPMFPHSKAPLSEKNKHGQHLVDLTGIYILKYSSDLTVEEVIDKLKPTGIIEFVEPFFVNQPLYIPNDDYVQPDSLQEFYFTNMKAYEAFDIEKGDTNVVIGIIDTGVEWNHEDLINNIKYNWADPINGIDDDGDGYLDNFRGWDVYYNDNDPTPPVNDHGTVVAGCAGATTDNNLGVAGTGFKCKILPIKASSNSGGAIYPGYDGIVYAAEHGAKVINLSWGGPNQYSALEQSVINYAAINWDAVVIAAAGNTADDLKFYPAGYDNVLSVSSVDTIYNPYLDSIVEGKAWYATYNYSVDVCAHGRRITSTSHGGYLNTGLGTSFAAPLVAGLAGLIRSKYPSLNALQVAELIRVTTDPLIDTLSYNSFSKDEKLGTGRINMYRALTDNTLPAIRMYRNSYYDNYGPYAFSDDTISIEAYFRNYLQATSNAQVTLSSISPNVTIVKNDFNIGSLNTLDSINNTLDPFRVYIHPEAGANETAIFRLGYDDPAKGYHDYQYFEILLNPAYIDIDTNQIALTMTSNGKLGFIDDLSAIGNGLVYKGESLLYEGGLMIGKNSNKVADCVRSNPAGVSDADFTSVSFVKYVGAFEGDEASETVFTDIGSNDSIGLNIKQRSYAYKNSPDDKYIIIEYAITNKSGVLLDSIYAGLFCDWDIQNYNQNKANWLPEDSLGYAYCTAANGIYAGVALLTPNPPSCFSMDHGNVGGNNINPNDGFPGSEKFTTLSQGVARPQAGGGGIGYDISQVVGGGLFNILPGETRTIAFAIVVGDDVLDIKANAERARSLFRNLNTSQTPYVSTYHFCNGDTVDVTIAPSNGSRFNFYKAPDFSNPVYTGSAYNLNDITASDSVYVSGVDSLFEGSLVRADILLHAELTADFTFSPDTVDLAVSPYAFFVDMSQHASQLNWSVNGENSSASSFMQSFQTSGVYPVTLIAKDSYNCSDTITKEVVVIGSPSYPFVQDGIKIYPNPSSGDVNIEFLLGTTENISINITNSLGEVVYKAEDWNVQFKNYLFNALDKGKGIYYARIKIGDEWITRKIIVQ